MQHRAGKRLITSVAAGATLEFLAHTDMRSVAKFVDTVNLMSYDYVEPGSSNLTGHHAPLFANPAAPKLVSADVSARAFLAAGVPPDKLILGVPFYGHAWSDVGKKNNGLFQAGKPVNIPADYRAIAGSLLSSGYSRYWDPDASAPYLYNSTQRIFVSYEDPESVRLKANYVMQHKLGGIMFWEYSGDSDGALLNAIDKALHITP
jgi:chitinase